ncbi:MULTISPECIES: DUF4303 domain-containing protein [Micrococcaceae]|uniref:DUF4303 domain-containing protein n=1 Tax=Arthrobacter rhombi TaxID=71253 RepID=A0A1R4GI64_9MICC|nr:MULTISPECIES: DUF4303 domain-containing protein [Micrococcaceae]SJM67775.1 hypothetical protein FM101_10590 [Arthrobacter rhombi]
MIEHHPDHVFYALALSGVSTDPAEPIELPVLALNSEQALDRDGDSVEEDFGGGDEPEEVEEDGDGPDPLNIGDDPSDDAQDSTDDSEEDTENDDDADGFDVDGELAQLEAEGEAAESGASYYSARWNPPEWHWCSMELFDESAAELWREALTRVAESNGWEETIRRYYELLLAVIDDLRVELAHGPNADIVAYVADDDHADALLRRSLTPEQLSRHFPDLVS